MSELLDRHDLTAALQIYALPLGGQYQFRMPRPRVQNFQIGSYTGDGVETYSKVWLAR